MTHTATATTMSMDQQIRNQMSLMAWIMAGLCGWVMFLSAHSISEAAAMGSFTTPGHYPTSQSAPQK